MSFDRLLTSVLLVVSVFSLVYSQTTPSPYMGVGRVSRRINTLEVKLMADILSLREELIEERELRIRFQQSLQSAATSSTGEAHCHKCSDGLEERLLSELGSIRGELEVERVENGDLSARLRDLEAVREQYGDTNRQFAKLTAHVTQTSGVLRSTLSKEKHHRKKAEGDLRRQTERINNLVSETRSLREEVTGLKQELADVKEEVVRTRQDVTSDVVSLSEQFHDANLQFARDVCTADLIPNTHTQSCNATKDPGCCIRAALTTKSNVATVSKLDEKLSRGMRMVADVEADVTRVGSAINQTLTLKTEVDDLRLDVSEKFRVNVAFSAWLHAPLNNLNPNQVINFGTLVTNDGEGYSPQTGKFTAPVAGTYLFHSTILSAAGKFIETAMKVNGEFKMRLYSAAPANMHGSGSNMIVLHLNQGDEAWMQVHLWFGTRPLYVHNVWSTFSGALLRSD